MGALANARCPKTPAQQLRRRQPGTIGDLQTNPASGGAYIQFQPAGGYFGGKRNHSFGSRPSKILVVSQRLAERDWSWPGKLTDANDSHSQRRVADEQLAAVIRF